MRRQRVGGWDLEKQSNCGSSLHQALMRLPSSLSSSRVLRTLRTQGSGGARPRVPSGRIRALCPALAPGLAHWKARAVQ